MKVEMWKNLASMGSTKDQKNWHFLIYLSPFSLICED